MKPEEELTTEEIDYLSLFIDENIDDSGLSHPGEQAVYRVREKLPDSASTRSEPLVDLDVGDGGDA